MKDNFGREIDYMRISITDRCNLRCRYCMPDGISLVQMENILTYEEIELVAKAATRTGIKKFKITGGEPLVRKGCPGLIKKLKNIPGTEQVTLTTNGVLLEQYIEELMDAGLDAVNISLDTVNPEVYKQITGRDEFQKVIAGLESAVKAGVQTKVNAVLQKGFNDNEWVDIIELAKKYPVDIRFIEIMPIGSGKDHETVFNEDLIEQLNKMYPDMKSDVRIHGNGPAVYYHIPGYQGSIGFISAIHGKFCGNCNRIRMTSQGQLKPCLCYGESVDVREIMRSTSCSELKRLEAVEAAIKSAIVKKPKQHCFEDIHEITENRKMIQIGG